MALFFLTLVLTLIAVLPLENVAAEQLGVCIETCSLDPEDPEGFGGCPEGYVCKSTGCGHICHLVRPPKRAQFGACIEACSPTLLLQVVGLDDCPEGYVCKSNGCGHTCQREIELNKRQRCAPVLCDMYCPNGFALDIHECEICQCKI